MAPHPRYQAAAQALRAAAIAAIARQQAEAAARAAADAEDGELVDRLDTSSVYEQQVCAHGHCTHAAWNLHTRP